MAYPFAVAPYAGPYAAPYSPYAAPFGAPAPFAPYPQFAASGADKKEDTFDPLDPTGNEALLDHYGPTMYQGLRPFSQPLSFIRGPQAAAPGGFRQNPYYSQAAAPRGQFVGAPVHAGPWNRFAPTFAAAPTYTQAAFGRWW
eukprot:TRINITY_DN969_c0_g1_i1.p2 TRINITY_DN969_c0_g1~~TRINITY_DN969_c0_g1_i1.p2  ORF type:complete len:142 (+),score=13.40 TRINITY_DN969_c0_g1_i1:32-457(+)